MDCMSTGYQALRESAAVLDLTGRGIILVRGEDRARLLHALCTNHVQQLQPGQGCYAFFLNAQGRVLADAVVLCREDHFLLDVEPEVRAPLYAHIDQYIIADDVTLEDASESTAVVALEGPAAAGLLQQAGAAVPETDYAHSTWEHNVLARVTVTGGPGFRLYAPVDRRETLLDQLITVGAQVALPGEADLVRLEHGRPRYGKDISDTRLPQETQQTHALHFTKGCYLGQEIVERIRSRGHVNRALQLMEIATPEPPHAGAKLTLDGKDAGEITSAGFSPSRGATLALGYVRMEATQPGKTLHLGELPVALVAPDGR